jgi:hypothetical protein
MVRLPINQSKEESKASKHEDSEEEVNVSLKSKYQNMMNNFKVDIMSNI